MHFGKKPLKIDIYKKHYRNYVVDNCNINSKSSIHSLSFLT
jgi:hypothetical protein